MNTLTAIPPGRLLPWLELCPRKFARWRERYGKANGHNAEVPRDHWLEPQEMEAIISYALAHPREGCRSLTFMMLDADVAAVAPETTYRVLKAAGLIGRHKGKPSKKGTGFIQPLAPHEHLAHRFFLSEHWRDVLLPVLRARRLRACHPRVGYPAGDAGDRCRDRGAEGPRSAP